MAIGFGVKEELKLAVCPREQRQRQWQHELHVKRGSVCWDGVEGEFARREFAHTFLQALQFADKYPAKVVGRVAHPILNVSDHVRVGGEGEASESGDEIRLAD